MKGEYVRYGFFVAILSLVAVILILSKSFVNQFLPPDYVIRTDGASVVTELKKLQRFETASFTIEKIIEAGTNGNVFQELLYGDRILLIAHGDVVAGFDLSNLSEDDIRISGAKISIDFPEPVILFARLDNDKTRVYDRDKGFLTSGDKNLESKARAAAEDSIRQAACEGNILNEAAMNGEKGIEALLRGFGFTDVNVNIPEGMCS